MRRSEKEGKREREKIKSSKQKQVEYFATFSGFVSVPSKVD